MGGEKGEIEESDRFFFSRTVLRNRIRKISRPSLRKGIGGDDVSAQPISLATHFDTC